MEVIISYSCLKGKTKKISTKKENTEMEVESAKIILLYRTMFCKLSINDVNIYGYKNYSNIAVLKLSSHLEIRNLCHNNVD